MPKIFHIGDVLSVSTGKLVSLRDMAGVYEILNYMMSADLLSHRIPRAQDMCQLALLRQHPWLAQLKPVVEELVLEAQKTYSFWGVREFLQRELSALAERYGEIEVLSLEEMRNEYL